MWNKITAYLLNILCPGAGYLLMGSPLTAICIQLLLTLSFLLVVLSRLIFDVKVLSTYLAFIGFFSFLNGVMGFWSKHAFNKKHLGLACLFIVITYSLITFSFTNKHSWFGLQIYFIPSMSMHPTLNPGDFILIDTWHYKTAKPVTGDVVVFEKNNSTIIKRVTDWPEEQTQRPTDQFYALGDNAHASQDSRHFGGVDKKAILGKAKVVLVGIDNHFNLKLNRLLLNVD